MVLDGKIKHLVLFDYGLFDKICDKIKYLISKKRAITNSIDSYNSLHFKKLLTFHNVIILIFSVDNKKKKKKLLFYIFRKTYIKINKCFYIKNAIL